MIDHMLLEFEMGRELLVAAAAVVVVAVGSSHRRSNPLILEMGDGILLRKVSGGLHIMWVLRDLIALFLWLFPSMRKGEEAGRAEGICDCTSGEIAKPSLRSFYLVNESIHFQLLHIY